jgi:methionine biosynthesis protein MetW
MMNVSDYYAGQAELREVGADIDGRVKKAGRLFQKHLGRAERLLDVGCGVGAVGLYLQEVLGAGEVHGLEISESRVAAAQQRGIRAVRGDLNQGPLPFGDGSFDAIFCGEIIEHLVDPDHLLDEIHRTLTPRGICVLTTPNLASWVNRLALLLGWQPFYTSISFRHEVGRPKFLVSNYGCRDHLRLFTLSALKQLLRLHGFRILGVKGSTIGEVDTGVRDFRLAPLRAFVYHALRPLDALASTFPSLSTRVIVAFKKRSAVENRKKMGGAVDPLRLH